MCFDAIKSLDQISTNQRSYFRVVANLLALWLTFVIQCALPTRFVARQWHNSSIWSWFHLTNQHSLELFVTQTDIKTLCAKFEMSQISHHWQTAPLRLPATKPDASYRDVTAFINCASNHMRSFHWLIKQYLQSVLGFDWSMRVKGNDITPQRWWIFTKSLKYRNGEQPVENL
jgi:hypothetical protein